MTVNLKVAKDEQCFFDGKHVSNGHIAFKVHSGVAVNRKELKDLIHSDTPFVYRMGVLSSTDNGDYGAKVPDIEAVMVDTQANLRPGAGNSVPAAITNAGLRFESQGWLVQVDVGNDAAGVPGPDKVYFQEQYIDIMEALKDAAGRDTEYRYANNTLGLLDSGLLIAVVKRIDINRINRV